MINENMNSSSTAVDDGKSAASSILLPWSLLEGEAIVNPETTFSEVIYLTNTGERIKGNLFITNFRIYFNSDVNEDIFVLDLPLGFIHRVEKLFNTNQMNELAGIIIYCKHGQKLNILKSENDTNFEKFVYGYLIRYAFPLSNGLNFFAFSYKPKLKNTNGWDVYLPEKEYRRMGVNESSMWYISKCNSDYKLSETYPRELVVPRFVDDKTLEIIAQFRSRARFPVLSWLSHGYDSASGSNGSDGSDTNTSHGVGIPILRASQPLCGMLNRRNYYDENYLKDIADMCSARFAPSSLLSKQHAQQQTPSQPVKYLYIFDARPFKNALANYTSGGGYENEKYYTSCKLVFLNIENIHAMRDSLGATSSEQFLMSTLENSKWLEHIRLILDGALMIVDKITSGHPCLVHCSDGWDRTAQLTSLAMMLLDKYYRTIEGFEVLIEKEWLSFGHKFGTRVGHGCDKYSDSDRSPIFIQFIDCIWQIMQDQPRAFEFNEKLLLTILHHIYTCQYGTFLLDSEFEREKNELKSKTISLWSYVNSNLGDYVNPEYMEYDRPIKITTNRCKLWTAYYFQNRSSMLNGGGGGGIDDHSYVGSGRNGNISMGNINGDIAAAAALTTAGGDKSLEPFGTLLDNLFSNSYRLFSKILEKN